MLKSVSDRGGVAGGQIHRSTSFVSVADVTYFLSERHHWTERFDLRNRETAEEVAVGNSVDRGGMRAPRHFGMHPAAPRSRSIGYCVGETPQS